MVQFVSVPLPHMGVAEYLFAELPGAGHTIVDQRPEYATSLEGIDPEFGGEIYFKDASGVPGNVTLQVQGEQTGLNFNVFTAEGSHADAGRSPLTQRVHCCSTNRKTYEF